MCVSVSLYVSFFSFWEYGLNVCVCVSLCFFFSFWEYGVNVCVLSLLFFSFPLDVFFTFLSECRPGVVNLPLLSFTSPFILLLFLP